MFTGLIEEIGEITSIEKIGDGLRLTIHAPVITSDVKVDDSIAINGCCLTATKVSGTDFTVEAVEETLKKTTLGLLKKGDQINLERAMKLSDRLGGHLVLGHVDGVGKIISIASRTTSWWVTIEVTQSLIKYAIPVGSVAVDGISLTVAELHDSRISVSIIPHTWEKTIIGTKKAGDSVNLEMDMIGKYVERLFGEKEKKSIITEEWLKSKGF